MKPLLVFDSEVYYDYYLASFMSLVSGRVVHFESFEGHPFNASSVEQLLAKHTIITFNGNAYDIPLLTLALEGKKCSTIKKNSDKIIVNNLRAWKLGIEPVECDHIDLIEVAPGRTGLKIYGGRLHCPTLQDLPIEPDSLISPEQRAQLRTYCENDLRTTAALYETLRPQIELRIAMGKQYGIDLRSKSDAQIAEVVIKSEVERLRGKPITKRNDPFDLAGETFIYKAPQFIQFATESCQQALQVVTSNAFVVAGNGVAKMPKQIEQLQITIGQSTYQMGMGGLHSTEKSVSYKADDQTVIIDRDVASYYPSIILSCGLAPENMGEHFTQVYRQIVNRRLTAKRNGDKVAADALKITINGTFGKLGSPYSCLYSPRLLVQVTLTGQLSLLMLIEALEYEGIKVVSANTDGVVICCKVDQLPMLDLVIWQWEQLTGFETEETRYLGLYSRDVNNYFAIKADGYKLKGVYAQASLSKNPANAVVIDAVVAWLRYGTPVESTVRSCSDVRKFLTLRTVRGGAVKGDQYLGKAIRWYWAQGETDAIYYKVNGNKVPNSDGGKPLMTLPDSLPTDLDYERYIALAYSILNDIGAINDARQDPASGPTLHAELLDGYPSDLGEIQRAVG